MNLPETFITKMNGAFGTEGEEFLQKLEGKIHTYANKWELTIEEHFENLSYNYVTRALDQNGKPVILKLGVPNYDFTNEVKALAAYDGNGCVSLFREDAEYGAMLLESLFPGNMLFEENEKVAIEEFAKVWKAIRRPAPAQGSAGWTYPSIMHWSQGLDRYMEMKNEDQPFSIDLVLKAKSLFQDVTNTTSGLELLHGDLHHENILYSDRYGWIAIDPKGVIGDPYFDLTSFLVNHLFDSDNPKELLRLRIESLIDLLQLDPERFLKASFAMAVLYACWGVEDNIIEDALNTYQCALWLLEMGEIK